MQVLKVGWGDFLAKVRTGLDRRRPAEPFLDTTVGTAGVAMTCT